MNNSSTHASMQKWSGLGTKKDPSTGASSRKSSLFESPVFYSQRLSAPFCRRVLNFSILLHLCLSIGVSVYFLTLHYSHVTLWNLKSYPLNAADYTWKPETVHLLPTSAENDFSSMWQRSPSIPPLSLAGHLSVLGCNPRPDLNHNKDLILIQLSSSERPFFVEDGCPFYIDITTSNTVIRAKEPTPYQITLSKTSSGSFRIDQIATFRDIQGKTLSQESSSQEVQETPYQQLKYSSAFNDLLKYVETSALYAPDLLYSLYGGTSFANQKGLYRLIRQSGDDQNTAFIEKNASLAFSQGAFSSAEKTTQGLPLLILNSVDNNIARFLLWDIEGLSCVAIDKPILHGPPLSSTGDNLFTKIHRRTSRSVICRIGKQNLILRKGDWLIQGKHGWKHLEDPEEIKKFLSYGIKSKLFIFNGIELKDDQYMFQGHLFDEMRACARAISIPIGKKQPQAISKRRPNSLNANRKGF